MGRLYRVQDVEGRGPYRPGFSRFWSNPEGPIVLPWWEELKLSLRDAYKMIPRDMFGGSAFQSLDQLTGWFLPDEREKLDAFGYYIVRFRPDKIIAETPTQVVFAQNYALTGLPFYASLTHPEQDTPNHVPEGNRVSVTETGASP